MPKEVLIVSSVEEMQETAAFIAGQVGVNVAVASSRREGQTLLRRTRYDAVVVDESLMEGDPDWADRIWQSAGNAMVLVVRPATSGRARLAREIGAALSRRDSDLTLARRAAADEIANDIKSPLTGLLLQSELALRDPSIPAAIQPKLLHIVELVGRIRERIDPGLGQAAK